MSTARGRHAESLAAEFLRDQGLTIVTRNFHAAGGEIDLVALDGDLYVFVEVKARALGHGVLSVDEAKAARVTKTAHAFLKEAGVSPEIVRFDIIEVDGSGEITHHQDAWRA